MELNALLSAILGTGNPMMLDDLEGGIRPRKQWTHLTRASTFIAVVKLIPLINQDIPRSRSAFNNYRYHA